VLVFDGGLLGAPGRQRRLLLPLVAGITGTSGKRGKSQEREEECGGQQVRVSSCCHNPHLDFLDVAPGLNVTAGGLATPPRIRPRFPRRTPMRTLKTLLDKLAFPEGPRWHDGRLFFSDM